jgi:hypothetical protein
MAIASEAPHTSTSSALSADVAVTPGMQPRHCARGGGEIVRRRRTSKQNHDLCMACDQRERRATYFRTYYEEHKERILDKNRRWARDNKSRIVQLRQARRAKTANAATTKTCLDCGTPVTRANRCRKCYIRFRYATDPVYRARRLATTRRWLEKRQAASLAPRRTQSSVGTKGSRTQMLAN